MLGLNICASRFVVQPEFAVAAGGVAADAASEWQELLPAAAVVAVAGAAAAASSCDDRATYRILVARISGLRLQLILSERSRGASRDAISFEGM